jgi:hypothetical protein
VNGKVERSHKADPDEFYRGNRFRHNKDLARKQKRREAEYNEDRPHLPSKEGHSLNEFMNSFRRPDLQRISLD